jgi:hypothetical protein
MATGYGRTDARAMRQENERRGRWEGEYVMGQDQKHLLRFLPPLKDGPFFFKYFIHYLPDGAEICPKWTWRQRCPICILGDNLYRSRDTAEIAQGRKLYRKAAYIANVIDVRNPDEGVQFLRFGKQIRDQLVGYFADPEDPEDQSEGTDITDPENGATIRITVVPPATPNDFRKYVASMGRPSPLAVKNWVKGLHDLEGLIKSKTKPAEELQELLSLMDEEGAETGGGRGHHDVDDDDDFKPAAPPRRSFNDEPETRSAKPPAAGKDLDEDEDFADQPRGAKPTPVPDKLPPRKTAKEDPPTRRTGRRFIETDE